MAEAHHAGLDHERSDGSPGGLAGGARRAADAAGPAPGMDRGVRALSCRASDLAKCQLFWPWGVADDSIAGRDHIIARLEIACRNERRSGLSGRWTYDLSRHQMMRDLLTTERAERAALRKTTTHQEAAST